MNEVEAPDLEGRALPDLKAAVDHARYNALFTAAELINEGGHLVRSHRIEIKDANGNLLETVHFEDVITIED